MRGYFVSLLLAVIVCAGCVSGILYDKYWIVWDLHDDPSLGQIIRFQNEKIASLPDGSIDTVFIGDSSLGNAIDAKLFDRLLNTRSVNLALTGSFAFGGGLVLLNKIAKNQPIKNVVLFYTIDAMARGNNEGYFFAGGSLFDVSLNVRDELGLLSRYSKRLLDARTAAAFLPKLGMESDPIPAQFYRDDYLVSDGKIRLDSELVTAFKMPDTIEREASAFLNAIANVCRKHSWKCIYFHGTMLERLALGEKAQAFVRLANQQIKTTGITLGSDTPMLIGDEDRGDTIYHVNWHLRPAYTRMLAAQVAPFIVP
jgi:hypothetical protein